MTIAPDRALILTRLGNVLHNGGQIVYRVASDPNVDWRRDARIALSHITQAQVELALWLRDQDAAEWAEAQRELERRPGE